MKSYIQALKPFFSEGELSANCCLTAHKVSDSMKVVLFLVSLEKHNSLTLT